jgi:hypothetical protein
VAIVRGAWLGLVVGLGYLAVTRTRSLLAAGPVLVVAAAAVVAAGLGGLFVTPSGFARLDKWGDAAGEVVEHPLGTGVGTTGAAGARAVEAGGGTASFEEGAPDATPVFQPDNHYMKVVLELGVVGLWLFVLVLVGAVRTATAATRRPDPDGALAAGILAFLLASAAAAVVATYFEIFPIDLHVWLAVGIATALAAGGEVPDGDRAPSRLLGVEADGGDPRRPAERQP